MKHFTHFKSSILRGLLSLFFLTAMVSSAWGKTKTGSWDFTSASSDWTASGNETYFNQPYGYKKVNGTLTNCSITDFSTSGITQIKVGFKCLQNGATTSKLTIYLVDKNGKTLGSGKIVTPTNATAASKTTYQYVTFTDNFNEATGFMMKVTTFGKNILINGAEYEVTYSPKLNSITISGTPNKTTYQDGDSFDPTGLTVTGGYDDGTNATITEGITWTLKPETLSKECSSCIVTASIGDIKSGDYTVNGINVIAQKKLSSITISGEPTRTSYLEGDNFSPLGLIVTATYSDDSKEDVTSYVDWTFDPIKLAANTTSVSVTAKYKGVEDCKSFAIEAQKINIASKTSFTLISGSLNEDISYESLKGGAGTAPGIYNNGIRLYQNGGYITITGSKGVKIHSVKVTSTIEYSSTTVGIAVNEEEMPSTGINLEKSSSYTFEGLNCNKVSLYCLGSTSSTRLEIAALEVKYTKEEQEVTSISISGEYQTDFTINTEFNHDGVVVNAQYSDGSQEVVTGNAQFSSPDMATLGEKTVTVSFGGKEVTYHINVIAPSLSKIELSGEYRTLFYEGDAFDYRGIVVTATYSNNTNTIVTEEAEFSAPNMNQSGDQTITVAFGGQKATYTIKVLPANTLFYESFDTNEGTGGNDDNWSGSIASNDIASDSTGWTFANANGAKHCIKLGTGSKLGSAKTPVITLTGSAKITFKAAAWNNNSEITTLNLSASQCTLSHESVTMTKAAWTEYTIYLYGVKGSTQITFAASKASNNRFFLDEVLIEKYVNPISISSVGYATYVTSSALNFDACEGITAYKVSVNEGAKTVNLSPIIEVPANEAIVVAGEAGTYNVPVIMSATALEDNNLIYSDVSVPVNAENKYYVLAYQNNEVCFAPVVSGSSIGARKGYFTISNGSAANYRIVIEDLENGNETAIPEIDPTGEVPLIIYTMTGIRIPKVVEDGLYIVNGKTKWMIAE